MNTPSHFLINYSLGRLLRLPQRYRIRMSAIVWGSLMPDMMLYALSVGVIAYYRFVRGWSIDQASEYAFGHLFFENIWWIILHNLLQAPLLLMGGLAVTAFALYRHRPQATATGASALPAAAVAQAERWRRVLLWLLAFLASALLHTVLDILTHHNDGPLLLFPFNFTVRFRSPVSYWDSEYYGRVFLLFELLLDAVCIGYLIYLRVQRRRTQT